MQDLSLHLKQQIFKVKPSDFEQLALQIFKFQAENNPVYKEYLKLLKVQPEAVTSLAEIPFLPVELFKTHKVISKKVEPDIIFSSSGTTGSTTSRHYVAEKDIYIQSFTKGFELFYGDPKDWVILALLPSYLEREGSSLIYMIDHLIKLTNNIESGYFLYDHEKLFTLLQELENQNRKTLLIGVSFALLDLAEKYSLRLKNTIVMETGGMKGRRSELIREELHQTLNDAFGVDSIHSEYGMTEILSQAYSKRSGDFFCPPWMRIQLRDINDPFENLGTGSTGVINIIDLANINSCSFIATSDLGRTNDNGSFQVLGRIDNSDIRGCNLLL